MVVQLVNTVNVVCFHVIQDSLFAFQHVDHPAVTLVTGQPKDSRTDSSTSSGDPKARHIQDSDQPDR